MKLFPKRFALLIMAGAVMGCLLAPDSLTASQLSPLNDHPRGAGTANVYLPLVRSDAAQTWSTVAGNPQRTSWVPEEVTGNVHIEWYRPIEAFIPQNTQIIASDGLLFISTAKGLYALNAATGALAWRFDTELPLGHSPTVVAGIVYVGGYDRQLHALRASDGAPLWAFDEALAGFSTNPLVVGGQVFAGNRDGNLYAIGAHGTPDQGQLLWKYQTGGLIDTSAAYQNGVVYFASTDNHAYALSASTGALIWKSAKLPGDGYHSYWPVIYQDKVVFAAASGYRTGFDPGTSSVKDAGNNGYGKLHDMERDDLFVGLPDFAIIGPTVPDQGWSHGKPIIDGARLTEYLEANPASDPYTHKPWRRTLIVLNQSNGSEYTFDSDGDGHPEYAPFAWWGTHSGNRYPPVIGSDGLLYASNLWQKQPIPQGKVMGWQIGTRYLSLVGGQGAVDEPQALSMGGNIMYRNLCCDRVGDWFSVVSNSFSQMWNYGVPLFQQAPGYDVMWYGVTPGDTTRLRGNYGTLNGLYNAHGDQNPIIPYQGRLYVHRSNAIIAYGLGPNLGALPLLTINPVTDTLPTPTIIDLQARLEAEVQAMIQAGHLRPGYYNGGQFSRYTQLASYFENPGDTLLTLARAYPHLSAGLQLQTKTYLKSEFQSYFTPTVYARTGWAEGAAREAMPLPSEVESALVNFPKSFGYDPRFSWQYPPHNFYGLWKYAELFPEDVQAAYVIAKSKLEVPVPAQATDSYLADKPFEHNAYIAGYIGFLELQELAGQTGPDAALRVQVQNELARLQTLRSSAFDPDSPWPAPWTGGDYHLRTLNIARNFIFLTPELGDYLNQTALGEMQTTVAEYSETAPYWFVSRYTAVPNEGVMQNLYNAPALFQARAYILKESRAELTKYLDVPAFERGDLFYIQNLVAAIEAP